MPHILRMVKADLRRLRGDYLAHSPRVMSNFIQKRYRVPRESTGRPGNG
jgi:hypothetical protein